MCFHCCLATCGVAAVLPTFVIQSFVNVHVHDICFPIYRNLLFCTNDIAFHDREEIFGGNDDWRGFRLYWRTDTSYRCLWFWNEIDGCDDAESDSDTKCDDVFHRVHAAGTDVNTPATSKNQQRRVPPASYPSHCSLPPAIVVVPFVEVMGPMPNSPLNVVVAMPTFPVVGSWNVVEVAGRGPKIIPPMLSCLSPDALGKRIEGPSPIFPSPVVMEGRPNVGSPPMSMLLHPVVSVSPAFEPIAILALPDVFWRPD